MAHCPFAGSHGIVWGTASCWRHGRPTQAALSCFAFCSVLGETRVSPIAAVPHRHSHTGCGARLPGQRLLLRSSSPRAALPGLPMCRGRALGASLIIKRDAFSVRIVGLKQIKRNSRPLNFQVNPEARVAEAEPVLRVQPCTHPCHLCQQRSFSPCSHTPPLGQGMRGTLWVSQLPSLIPKGGKRTCQQCLLHCPRAQISLPRTGGDGSAGKGRRAG